MSWSWHYAVASGVLLIAVVPLALVIGARDDTGARRDDIKAFTATIRPMLQEGGRVVATGVRPALTSIALGEITPDDFAAQAPGWQAELLQVRRRLDAVEVPAGLQRAIDLYDLALRQYEQAIDGFVVAARAPAGELEAAIGAAVPAAEKADKTYDRADAIVVAELRRHDLPVPPAFQLKEAA